MPISLRANGEPLLNTYQCVCAGNCVILRTNRTRCALYMKILDLLDEESVFWSTVVRASLLIQEVLLRMFEKASQSLNYNSQTFLGPQPYIYLYTYTKHKDNTDHFTLLTLRGVIICVDCNLTGN